MPDPQKSGISPVFTTTIFSHFPFFVKHQFLAILTVRQSIPGIFPGDDSGTGYYPSVYRSTVLRRFPLLLSPRPTHEDRCLSRKTIRTLLSAPIDPDIHRVRNDCRLVAHCEQSIALCAGELSNSARGIHPIPAVAPPRIYRSPPGS